MPADIHQRVWVHVGEAGERSEELAYGGTAFPPGPLYNVIAAQSSVPVVRALLPGAKAECYPDILGRRVFGPKVLRA